MEYTDTIVSDEARDSLVQMDLSDQSRTNYPLNLKRMKTKLEGKLSANKHKRKAKPRRKCLMQKNLITNYVIPQFLPQTAPKSPDPENILSLTIAEITTPEESLQFQVFKRRL